MSEFHAAYPDYATTSRLDDLRAAEYSYLDAGGHTYLDYTGAGLAADAQLRAHAERLRGGCFGNPHSENPTSSASTRLIEQARDGGAQLFQRSRRTNTRSSSRRTPPARAAWSARRIHSGRMSRFVLTADNHNSVNGIREFARARGAATRYVRLSPADLRVSRRGRRRRARARRSPTRLERGPQYGAACSPTRRRATSAASSTRWPGWIMAQAAGYDVLLDAAAFVPANRLDLGAVKPEFVTVSLYKMFGYPTGIGCLLARRDALARLRRPWFSGGTIWGVSVQGGWHRLADDETRVRGRHAQLPRHPRRHDRPGLDQRHRHRPDPPAGRLPDQLAARQPHEPQARQRRADGARVRSAG